MEVQELNSFYEINSFFVLLCWLQFFSLWALVVVIKVKELFWYSEYYIEVGWDKNAFYEERGGAAKKILCSCHFNCYV